MPNRSDLGVAMSLALERCARYAPVHRPVVFVGPVGAGKTTLASALHRASGRTGRMVSVTSGEASESMYRDSLFGHVRGAFTGATSDRAGAIERAANGTLLLDDLAFLPVEVQVALLRTMEEGAYYPIGSDRERSVTCRFLFATTVPLATLVESGSMIPDLRSRLGEFVIRVPGLADRRQEIPGLARTFAADFRVEHGLSPEVDFSEAAIRYLQQYDWPTNVRGLRHVVERAIVHAGLFDDLPLIEPVHLPDRVVSFDPDDEAQASLNRALVSKALRDAGGNQSEAARQLGVHRNTIARWVRRLE